MGGAKQESLGKWICLSIQGQWKLFSIGPAGIILECYNELHALSTL